MAGAGGSPHSHRAGDGQYRPGPPPAAPIEVSAELLGQSDDDALRATQEAEPVDVLVLRDLATSSAPWLRRRATTSSMSSTANMMRRMPSVFAGAFRLGFDRRRRVGTSSAQPGCGRPGSA